MACFFEACRDPLRSRRKRQDEMNDSISKADPPRAWSGRSRALLLYVAAVDALAVGIFLAWDKTNLVEHGLTVFILALLAGFMGVKPVRVPALRTEVTTNDAFALCALGAVGPVPAA